MKQFPHGEYRDGQKEAVEFLQGLDKQPALIYAPTGSGKSAIATMTPGRSIVMMATRDLQDQYSQEPYNWTPLKGKANYTCNYRPKVSAEDCAFQGEQHKCPNFLQCNHLVAKERAKAADQSVFNYSLWNAYRNVGWPEAQLILDEAHELAEIVTDWAGTSIGIERCEYYGLPNPPMIRTNDKDKAIRWMQKSIQSLSEFINANRHRDDMNRVRQGERMSRKLQATIEAIEVNGDHWFIRSGPGAVGDGIGLTAKPLTASNHFRHYFGDHPIMMTATPGKIEAFASSLGLDNMLLHEVPHRIPASSRPIDVLDAPRMGRKTTEEGHKQQARVIAEKLDDLPSDWSGLLHTNSYAQARYLASNLRSYSRRPIMVPDQRMGKDEQIVAWQTYRDKVGGAVYVAPNLHSGYDGRVEKFTIACKVPYPSLGDSFERARQKHDGKLYLQRAGQKLEQSLGRVRRSDEDYEPGATYVGLADKMHLNVRKYLSPDIQEAIANGSG